MDRHDTYRCGMVLEFIGTVIPEQEPDDNGGETGTEENEDGLDGNGIKLPAEFKGMTITSDGTAYFYTDKNGKQVRCYFVGTKDENGTTKVDFWFDTHTDRFVPYN